MEEFLKSLGIKEKGHSSDNKSYVVDIANSDTWGKYYSILSKSEELDELEESSLLTSHNASITFAYESEDANYQLNLIADYDNDAYKLVVTTI